MINLTNAIKSTKWRVGQTGASRHTRGVTRCLGGEGWDQVSGRSVDPLLTGHNRHESYMKDNFVHTKTTMEIENNFTFWLMPDKIYTILKASSGVMNTFTDSWANTFLKIHFFHIFSYYQFNVLHSI